MSFRKLSTERKAQTSIEYLLILAGVVLIVVIVGLLLKNVAQAGGTAVYCQEHPNDPACTSVPAPTSSAIPTAPATSIPTVASSPTLT